MLLYAFVALQTQCPEAMVSPLFEGIRDEVESRRQMLQSKSCTQQVPQALCLWGDVRANYTSATIFHRQSSLWQLSTTMRSAEYQGWSDKLLGVISALMIALDKRRDSPFP